MNRNKNLKQTQSESIAHWLHMALILGFIVTFGIINCGCNNEEVSDEYYVKYVLSSSTIYYGGKLNVTISTESSDNMALVVDQRTNWETIIGPVSKGFDAKLLAVAAGETHYKLKLYAEIHVSKNDSPFTLKEINTSDIPRDYVEIVYTIDY